MRVGAAFPRASVTVLAMWLALSVAPQAASRWQGFREGNEPQPRFLSTTVAPADEADTVRWLRQHASPEDLILAPTRHAPWVATAPMHSFGSHWLFSVTVKEQERLADAFFDGTLAEVEARRLLDEYGVRFVLVPQNSRAVVYLPEASKRATIGSFDIYEFSGHTMKAYPASLRAN